MKKPSLIATGAIMLLLMIGNTNCSKNNNSGPAAPTIQVQLQVSPTLGNFLVDKNMHTMYFFANDVKGQSTCTGNCETNWPVVSDSNLTATQLGAGLKLSDFSTIKTSEGKTQLTYKGWPLYNFSPAGAQEAAGQITGDAVAGLFFVAKPDYTTMIGSTQLVGLDGNDYLSNFTIGTGSTTYMTDAWGATLYAFALDSAGENKFTKSDFSNNTVFPIYDTTNLKDPSLLQTSSFTNTTVFGKTQLTYNGWPLYYYSGDSAHRGSTKAISLGPKKWPVLTAATAPAP